MKMPLNTKTKSQNILLGVCGSISCYKAYDICREWVKLGHRVRVIVSDGAENFIQRETFIFLGAEKVYKNTDDFNIQALSENSQVLHIELARWMDRLVIAPLTANTMSLLSEGRALNLLTSVFISNTNKPTLLYPAMNTSMLNHPFTKMNIEKLKSLDFLLWGHTQKGILACGEEGEGKLALVEDIVQNSLLFCGHKKREPNKKVLITTGASISAVDPIRFLTNASSGKTGLHLAKKFLAEGYEVEVLSGMNSSPLFKGLTHLPYFYLTTYQSTSSALEIVKKKISSTNLYISAAAFNDIEFPHCEEKLKKAKMSHQLEILKAPDILQWVLREGLHEKLITIGFAAETELTPEMCSEKWNRKPTQLLIANSVSHGGGQEEKAKGFGKDDGEYYWIEKGDISFRQKMNKIELADKIFSWADAQLERINNPYES